MHTAYRALLFDFYFCCSFHMKYDKHHIMCIPYTFYDYNILIFRVCEYQSINVGPRCLLSQQTFYNIIRIRAAWRGVPACRMCVRVYYVRIYIWKDETWWEFTIFWCCCCCWHCWYRSCCCCCCFTLCMLLLASLVSSFAHTHPTHASICTVWENECARVCQSDAKAQENEVERHAIYNI